MASHRATRTQAGYSAAAAVAGENGPLQSSSETATAAASRSHDADLRTGTNDEIITTMTTNGKPRRVNLFPDLKGDIFSGRYIY